LADYSKYIWHNNKIVNWDSANIHVMSHVIHYGSGVFEGIKCYNTHMGPAIFRLSCHIDRLFQSAEAYNIKIPFDKEAIMKGCIDIVNKNALTDCYIRPITFYGYDTLGVNPKECPVNVSIAAFFWGAYLGEKGLEKGVNICLSPWQKFSYKAMPSTAKGCGQYMNSMLSVNYAKSNGYDEGLLLDTRGFIAEGSGQNIFIVKSGKVYTNDEKSSILLGITRETIIQLCKELNIEIIVKDLTLDELIDADEAFFSGTASEITPIVSLDGKKINSGEIGVITNQLKSLYMNIVLAKSDSHLPWLTFIK
tara:strand:- start:126 stop:1046 length:921 start_codon:yes stop_codon:yes gene_type:complete